MNAWVVIARSAATKQSNWIATARFAPFAMTNLLRCVAIHLFAE